METTPLMRLIVPPLPSLIMMPTCEMVMRGDVGSRGGPQEMVMPSLTFKCKFSN